MWGISGNSEVIFSSHLPSVFRPADPFPTCRGEKCDECRHVGKYPTVATLLAGEPVAAERPTEEVSVFWSETPSM